MKTWLRNRLVVNWQRKGISVVLALIVWIVVNDSLTEKTPTKPQLYSSLNKVQAIHHKQLEDRFVSESMALPQEEGMKGLSAALREEIFRYRFRNYTTDSKALAPTLPIEQDAVK